VVSGNLDFRHSPLLGCVLLKNVKTQTEVVEKFLRAIFEYFEEKTPAEVGRKKSKAV
jgi:hypothetical protein